MRSTAEIAIVKFPSRFKEKVGSIFILPEWAVDELYYAETVGTVMALPERTGDYPTTLKVGDTVRCEYGSMDDKNPLDMGDGELYFHLHLSEILYKINEDGSPVMQHGWVLGSGLPVVKPEWSTGHQVINGIPYWMNKFGHCVERINMTEQKNKMLVHSIGETKPSLGELEFKVGDVVIMEPECEFTNHGNNVINGRKYWFVRQEDIIGKIE